MGKQYFPMFMDISEKKVVVIGGGTIAARRVNTLLSFAEKIVVAAPKVTDDLRELDREGRITWLCGEYCIEQIWNADIVIAATNRPEVNHQVKADCIRVENLTKRRIWVSVIDDKELCDFYFPSIVQKEAVVVGINSGGKSPGLTKHIRKKIEALLNSDSIYE